MTKKIAIPMQNGKVSSHFGHCEYFAIAEVKENQIVEITEHKPPKHEPGVYPRWVATLGVTDVIAAGMGQRAINLFHEQNINVFVGAPLEGAREIVEKFLAGTLELSANCCDH